MSASEEARVDGIDEAFEKFEREQGDDDLPNEKARDYFRAGFLACKEAENEACAKIASDYANARLAARESSPMAAGEWNAAADIAAAIRFRAAGEVCASRSASESKEEGEA